MRNETIVLAPNPLSGREGYREPLVNQWKKRNLHARALHESAPVHGLSKSFLIILTLST